MPASSAVSQLYSRVVDWATDYLDLPSLRSIKLGKFTLSGDGSEKRETIKTRPFNYKNTLTMKSGIK